MPASQTQLARGLEAPVLRFENHEAAVQAMDDYQAALRENAAQRRSHGLTVTDQDQPEEVFCLLPPHPERPPLTIIGGMGPAAGAMAFRRACERFRNLRSIVLYQACSIPDRSSVILNNRIGPHCPSSRELASRLADAVRLSANALPSSGELMRCIIACNSAHYFWHMVNNDLAAGGRPCYVRMISLVESSVAALRFQSCRSVLLLETEGARAGQVFSAPFRDAGITFDQPPAALSHLLMSAIFEGIKSLDESTAVELGDEFFETTLRSGRQYDCVLAGCTEIPLIIALLRQRGSSAVIDFLSRVKIVDPMEQALRHA